MKKLTVILLSAVLVFAMTACGGGAEEPAADAPSITVEIEIDYPDESGMADVEDLAIEVPEGSTLMDVMKAYVEANDVELTIDDGYVTCIGGVEASGLEGWVYEVNDEMVLETADEFIVNAGDEISWEYKNGM